MAQERVYQRDKLSFKGKSSCWKVKPTGNWKQDNELGKRIFAEYMNFLATRTDDGQLPIERIISDMRRGGEKVRGNRIWIEHGFFTALNEHLKARHIRQSAVENYFELYERLSLEVKKTVLHILQKDCGRSATIAKRIERLAGGNVVKVEFGRADEAPSATA